MAEVAPTQRVGNLLMIVTGRRLVEPGRNEDVAVALGAVQRRFSQTRRAGRPK